MYDICLIFPPVWYAEYPYLSTATLKAYLETKKHKVLQKDLNIDFFEKLKQKDELRQCYKKAKENLKNYNISGAPKELKEITTSKSFEEFKERLEKNQISLNILVALITLASQSSNGSETTYHDPLFGQLSLSKYASSTKNLKKIINDKRNTFLEFREEIKKIPAKNFGITIVALNQVVPAFTLASLIKQETNAKVFLGGPWASLLNKKLLKKEIFNFFDVVCFFEGEKALDMLIKKENLKSIPNIAYMKNGKIIINKIEAGDINSLPTPNFDDIPLKTYFYQKLFPLQTTKSCYWKKCLYCSYPTTERNYCERKIDLVISDIKKLSEKYGAQKIMFMDSCIKPKRLEEIAQKLLEEKIKIKFGCYARFDHNFRKETFQKAFKVGLRELCWGMESGSEKVLKTIRKGVSLKDAQRILKESKECGIHNRVVFMYDLPTEEKTDFEKTLTFFKKNRKNIDSFMIGRYTPEINTGIEKESKNLGIKLTPNKGDLCLSYDYLHSLKEKEIYEIVNKFYS